MPKPFILFSGIIYYYLILKTVKRGGGVVCDELVIHGLERNLLAETVTLGQP